MIRMECLRHYFMASSARATFTRPELAPGNRSMNENISALQDFREIATLPVAAALAALALTWLVWYFTGDRCTEDLATTTGCNTSSIATFITPALLKDMLTNSAIAATGGGVWSYVMITRERRAREAAEKALAEERQHKEEALARVAEERQRAAEERRRADEERWRAEEGRRRADEDRARLLAEIERLSRQLDAKGNGQAEN